MLGAGEVPKAPFGNGAVDIVSSVDSGDMVNMLASVENKLCRPMFRVQFKQWIYSNVGDFIEYEMIVQALEGSRFIRAITKRYTDFVTLNEDLSYYIKM